MAGSIVVSCPNCNKQIRAPEEARGKQVRCKACGEVFPLSPGGAAGPAAPARSKSPPGRAWHEQDDDDGMPYDATTLDLAPRCPACATEMESDEAIICISCGYNTVTRQKAQTLKVIRTTFLEWLLWLGPGILAFLAIIPLVGLILYLWAERPEVKLRLPFEALAFEIDGDPPKDTRLYIRIWGAVFALAAIFAAGRYAVKRLILNFKPPLKIKSK